MAPRAPRSPSGRFTVVIVGRPNVGKSTLFNRLAGRRLALVHDTPGVTRDRREAECQLGDHRFRLIDTAGLEEGDAAALETRMIEQTRRALDEADLAIFVFDARAGVTPRDEYFAHWLRRAGAPVVLVANKCEGRAWRENIGEAYSLGFGEPIALSAEHGEGIGDLHDALLAAMAEMREETAAEDEAGRPLHLAIVGRPNAGKSTLLNRLLGEERVITGPEPGLTRDSIAIDWSYSGRDIRLFDTAGLRRQARVTDSLERLSAADTRNAIRFADVVVVMIDAETVQDFGGGFEKQDLTIARQVEEEGRALVIAVNKWDRVDDKARQRAAAEESADRSLAQIRGVPVVFISALDGTHLDTLMQAVLAAEERWSRRIPTAQLNRWLEEMVEHHPPPMAKGRRLRIRYMTQVKARPPTFALFVSRPEDMPDSYLNYLANGLREAFDLWGVPLRLTMRKGKNPYA